MGSLTVELAERSYEILTARGLAAKIRKHVDELASQGRKCAVVTDETVAAAQQEFLHNAFGDALVLTLPAGESTKSFRQLAVICEALAKARVDRSGVLFAFGGGVIGDLAGYAAASYLRGIQFIQLPTTLLAMVDSSVGGKTGINLKAGKNLVGAFWQPQAVFMDLDILNTLPPREFNAGMAEIIKYGLLGDLELFEILEQSSRLNSRSKKLTEIVERCCAIKARIVKEDERETASSGGRALLNLGHTFAHAIENTAGYGTYLHGEAVAVGLMLASRLSCEMGLIEPEDTERVRALLHRYELPTRLRAPLHIHRLMDAMKRDKKVRAGTLRFVVMEKLGTAITHSDISSHTVKSLWREAGAV